MVFVKSTIKKQKAKKYKAKKYCFVLPLLLLSAWAQAQQYDVTVKGVNAGKAALQYEINASTYAVSLALYPSGVAKLFGVDDMQEKAAGVIKANQFYPESYGRYPLSSGGDTTGEPLLSVAFIDDMLEVREADGYERLPLMQSGQDPLTQILQIQQDIAKGQLRSEYILVTDTNQRTYVATLDQQANTNQVQLTQAAGGERVIKLWFDVNNTLLKMQKIKRGKIDFEIIKRDVSG
ncbi:hypothetical protein [Ostreibacterium oceani]|uniref:DUF3108 domain-containing protein n=1 Tax=Ostreibacterium oceani TaxID=2654998 RepID=A0A6N7EU69_9GAMM|nr:hypothetical protein [Ostreibacterium oceani]MPV85155.1 hypothetical protein [Ostreibacterium oceani]